MVQQQLVKSAAIHVIGVILIQAQLWNFTKPNHVLAAVAPVRPHRAVFMNKVLLLHRRKKSDVLENASGRADQRFADVRAGMHSLVQNKMVNPSSREVSAQRRSGRAAANNNHRGVTFRGARSQGRSGSRLASVGFSGSELAAGRLIRARRSL